MDVKNFFTKKTMQADLEVARSSSQDSRSADQDKELLETLGYKQELKRTFGLISMIGFCFSILTCWTALSGSLGEVFLNGGPLSLYVSWIVVSFFTIFVILSLADICSAYPTAGGQYSWCLILGRNTWWGRVTSYACAWIQLAGVIAMGSGSPYQFGLMAGTMAELNTDGEFVVSRWRIVLMAYACGLLILLMNLFANRILHYLSSIALYWSIGGFVICTVVLLACTSPNFASANFVFTTMVSDGWSNKGMAFILGFCQSAYSMCCYDAPAHMAEEMQDASRDAPRAMVLSVFIGFITGLAFIFVLLFSIQNLDQVANSDWPLLQIFYQATKSKPGTLCLNFIILMCQTLAGISLLTEGSRCVYAMARDGCFPWFFNRWLMQVSDKLDGVPVPAVLVTMAFQLAFIALLFASDAAYFTVLSISSTGLYVSYLMPIVTYFLCPDAKAPGYYNLSKWPRIICHVGAIIYLTFCIVFFFFPTQLPVDGNNMNYCIAAFGIAGVFGIVSWFGGARHTYIKEIATEASGIEQLDAMDYSTEESPKIESDKI